MKASQIDIPGETMTKRYEELGLTLSDSSQDGFALAQNRIYNCRLLSLPYGRVAGSGTNSHRLKKARY